MRRIDFKVPIYDWDITVITLYGPSDAGDYRNLLASIEASPESIEQTVDALKNGCINGGDFWYDKGKRTGLVSIFPWNSDDKLWEVLNHEKRHLIDRILEWAGMHDNEAAAFLDGYVSKEIMSKLKELTT